MAEGVVMSGAPIAQLGVRYLSPVSVAQRRPAFSQRFCPARSVEILSNRCKSTVDVFVMSVVLRAFVRLGATI